jgi:hypothetical protein
MFAVGHLILYGCESNSVTVKEHCKFREPEIRLLRRMFGPKTKEITEEQKICKNKALRE